MTLTGAQQRCPASSGRRFVAVRDRQPVGNRLSARFRNPWTTYIVWPGALANRNFTPLHRRIACRIPPGAALDKALRGLRVRTTYAQPVENEGGGVGSGRAGRDASGRRVECHQSAAGRADRYGPPCGEAGHHGACRRAPARRLRRDADVPAWLRDSGSTSSSSPTTRSRTAAPSTDGCSSRFRRKATGRATRCGQIARSPDILDDELLSRRLGERRDQVAALLEHAVGPVHAQLDSRRRPDCRTPAATGAFSASGQRFTSGSACLPTSGSRR